MTKKARRRAVYSYRLSLIVFLWVLQFASVKSQWVRVMDGQVVLSLAVKDSILFAGASGGIYIPGDTAYYGGAFRSTDLGLHWKPINSGLTSRTPFSVGVQTFALNGSRIFAGTTSNGIFFSDDDGSNWMAADSGLTDAHVRALLVRDRNIFAGTYGAGVFLSADDGSSWLHADSGLTNKQVCSLATIDSNLFAGTWLGGLFISSSNGTSWSWCPGLSNSEIKCLAVGGSKLFAGMWGGPLFRSVDDGRNWTRSDSGMSWITVNSLATHGSNLFAGTESGFFISTDSGTIWHSANEGLSQRRFVWSLLITGPFIFAGTDTGIYRRQISEMITSIEGQSARIVTGFVLDQNYPNPFNPTTTIRYEFPQRSHVTLTVFSTLGQQLAVLQNGEQEAGYHEVKFDGSNLASGVYFYRLQAGSFVQTKKLLLLH